MAHSRLLLIIVLAWQIPAAARIAHENDGLPAQLLAVAQDSNPRGEKLGRTKNTNHGAAWIPLTKLTARPVREPLAARELTYVVEPIVQGESCRLRVSLIFRGDSSGKTRLLLPLEWADGVELYRGIRNINSLSEDTKIEDTKEPHVKIVHHRPNQRVSLTYEVVSQPPGTKLTRELYHYPVLRPILLLRHGPGVVGLPGHA